MTEPFRYELRRHTIRDVPIVEVWRGKQFVATIVESEDGGSLRVVSKYLEPSRLEPDFDTLVKTADGRIVGSRDVRLKIED